MSAVSTRRRKGISLAKGPIAIVGMLGIAMGVCGLIFGGHGFHIASVPHGSISGKRWLGIELNGWTNLLFIAAGLFLLLGSPAHWGAKAAAWIVAGVLGAAAIIAVIRGNGIFGIFAADHRTEIIWGAAAVVLLVLSLLPRVGRREPVAQTPPGARGRPAAARDEPAVARDRGVTREESAETQGDRTVIRDDPAAVGHEPSVAREVPAAAPDEAAADRNASAVTRGEPVAAREEPGVTQEDPAVTGEEPGITREDPAATRKERGVTPDDPGAGATEPAATRDDELVSPRDDPRASSEEPPART
jgi:hypothetical protein